MPFITVTYPPKYPLTASEKKWLEGKSEADYPALCVRTGKRGLFDMRYCLKACEGNSASSPKYCPIASDFRDAAEFEARVVKEALHVTVGDLPCADGPDCKAPHFDKYSTEGEPVGCSMCALCAVRLAVEAEMEKEGK